MGWNCGPEGGRGLKQFRPGFGPAKIVGNFLHGAGDQSQIVGFEMRHNGPDFIFVNNGTVQHANRGILFSVTPTSNPETQVKNNLSWQNGSGGFWPTSGTMD